MIKGILLDLVGLAVGILLSGMFGCLVLILGRTKGFPEAFRKLPLSTKQKLRDTDGYGDACDPNPYTVKAWDDAVAAGPRASPFAAPYPLSSASLREAFHNGCEHTDATTATVRIRLDHPDVRLGVGLNAANLRPEVTIRVGESAVGAFNYSYDAANRIVARNDDSFAYNDRDEVTRATIGDATFEHAYDTIGNHLLWTDQTATNLSEHNTLNQIVREILQDSSSPTSACATNALTWAAVGGLQSDGRWVYCFDAEDRLESVTDATLTNDAQRNHVGKGTLCQENRPCRIKRDD